MRDTQLVENIGIMGGRAPSLTYAAKLLPDVLSGKLDVHEIFDKTIKLEQIQEGYEAMDKRQAIKTLIKFDSSF